MYKRFVKCVICFSVLIISCGCTQTNSSPITISLSNDSSSNISKAYCGKDYIFVPVTINYNGKTLTGKFLLDTGSPYTILSKKFSERLGLTLNGKSYFVGNFPVSKKSYKMTIAYVNKLNVANRSISKFIVEYGDYLMTDIESADGIIGNDALHQIGDFQINYRANTITWGT